MNDGDRMTIIHIKSLLKKSTELLLEIRPEVCNCDPEESYVCPICLHIQEVVIAGKSIERLRV